MQQILHSHDHKTTHMNAVTVAIVEHCRRLAKLMMASIIGPIYFFATNFFFFSIILSAANARHEAQLRLLAAFTPSALASPCVWHPLHCASNSAIVLGHGIFHSQANEQPYRWHGICREFGVPAEPVGLFLWRINTNKCLGT